MQSLKDDKVQQTNRLENKNMHSSCKEAISKVILAIEEQIIVLEKEINEHINNYPHLKNMVENLKTYDSVISLKSFVLLSSIISGSI